MTDGKMRYHSKISILVIALVLSCTYCARNARVENLGIFGESRKESVLGQDGCTPIPVNGIMMWTFGDTIIGSWKGELTSGSTFEETAVMKGMISNSLAFTEVPGDATIKKLRFVFNKKEGAVVPFIETTKAEDPRLWRLWAIDGIKIDATIYVYYMIVFVDKSIRPRKGELPIRVMGVGLAEWQMPQGWKPGSPVRFRRIATIFREGEPVFGDSVIRIGDYLYLSGHGPSRDGTVPAYISRVRVSAIRNRNSYEFLDSEGGWSRQLARATPIAADVMGEPSLVYNDHLKQYVFLYCSTDGSIKSILFPDFKHALNKKARVVYTPPALPHIKSREYLFYYSGKEIFQTEKALYAIYINPAIYQPILLRIPYSILLDK
ncbi:MAG TPA: DUF4185 domain-containing protein [Spirochaetota bacterium]|nr:DUF4185 domain-containing protein [Spirochaetota bacterium]HPG49867.1 DUF4185 domain-containing protein [Spirochaetota bacterium]HPN12529.1 DUF4185 domain-containing protein [Spirochaetota bacterium]